MLVVRPAWQPDLAFLATLLRARLQADGDENATFTTDSRPTLADAQSAMEAVVDLMAVDLPDLVPERFWAALGRCASYGAAAVLEPSHQPEQTRSDQSPLPTWEKRHEKCTASLTAAVLADAGDGTPGDGPAGAPLPLGCFPCGPLVSGQPW